MVPLQIRARKRSRNCLAQDFAVILLDMQMPDMKCFEVARLVRSTVAFGARAHHLRDGASSGHSDILRGLEDRRHDYIAVPVVPEILRSKVAVLVELHQRRAELKRLNADLAVARAQLADELTRDNSDHKRTEAALRDSERVFKALVENATVGVARNSLEGAFLYVNPGFCEIVGYNAEELLQMSWQQITHSEDLEMDMSNARRVVSGEASSYTVEKRYVHKDGRIVWVRLFGRTSSRTTRTGPRPPWPSWSTSPSDAWPMRNCARPIAARMNSW